MTVDELIKELNEIKKKRGGNLEVFYADGIGHGQILVTEVDYISGGMATYEGVTIS